MSISKANRSMNYRTRSNDVRAEARNILVELRNERIAKKNLLIVRPATDETAYSNSPQSTPSEFHGSPELVSVLKEMFTKPRETSEVFEHTPEIVPAEPIVALEPVIKKKSIQKKPGRRRAAVSSVVPLTAPASIDTVESVLIATAPAAIIPESSVVVAQTLANEPIGEPITVSMPLPVMAVEAPASEPVHARESVAELVPNLPIVSLHVPELVAQLKAVDPLPSPETSKYALSSASDNISPFSLERLPMIGPGLVWHLQKAGVHSLDDLAFEDVDGLIKRLGAISELMRLTDWIRLAKEQDQASSEAA